MRHPVPVYILYQNFATFPRKANWPPQFQIVFIVAGGRFLIYWNSHIVHMERLMCNKKYRKFSLKNAFINLWNLSVNLCVQYLYIPKHTIFILIETCPGADLMQGVCYRLPPMLPWQLFFSRGRNILFQISGETPHASAYIAPKSIKTYYWKIVNLDQCVFIHSFSFFQTKYIIR